MPVARPVNGCWRGLSHVGSANPEQPLLPSDVLRSLEACLQEHLPDSLEATTRNALLRDLASILETAKLEALAELAAGAGHEINNPIATIAGRVQLLLPGEKNPGRKNSLEVIGGQAFRVRDMIGDLMLFARPPQPHCQACDVAQAWDSATKSLADLIRKRNCKLSAEVKPDCRLWADPSQLAVVLTALLRNSLEAADLPDCQIHITTRDESSGMVLFLIADNGPGLSEEQREHLFDPFYSGRQAGRGLGFGLAKAWRIVRQHGGTIAVFANEPRGLRFEINWPGATASTD